MSSLSNLAFQGAVGLSVTCSFIVSGVELSPPPDPKTSDYFEIVKFEAKRAGETALFDYERVIHQRITMEYAVRVMERKGAGWSQFCKHSGSPLEYQTDAVLPDSVDLSWLTDGECETLPDGASKILITWTPLEFGLKPVSAVATVK